MDGLRWLLLLCGLLVVAGVYVLGRRERDKPAKEHVNDERRAPSIGAEPGQSLHADIADDPSVTNDTPKSPQHSRQKIVTVRIVARHKGAFRGDELILCLRGIGMRSGKFGIYHRYDGNDENKTVFSAASLVEPGSFDLANIKEQHIPGISMFLVLPGPIEGAEAFDLMMQAARSITKSMDADLLDETGSTLSIQRERYMREEVIQFQHHNVNIAG